MPISPVQLSETSDARTMVLSLSDLRYLFEAPDIDPLAGIYVEQSGVDAVLQRLKREKLRRANDLTLKLNIPTEQIGPGTQTQVKDALAVYAGAQIENEEDGLALLRRETLQSLLVGGLFLATCLVLAALVDQFQILPSFAQELLRESLVIAGWVGLWHPMELLLYSWWPNRYRIGLLRRLKAAKLELQPG